MPTLSIPTKLFPRYLVDSFVGRISVQNFMINKSFSCQSKEMNGILLPKLFWPTVRKNCSSDPEKLLKFEAEGQEVAKCLRSLDQFIQTLKVQNNIW